MEQVSGAGNAFEILIKTIARLRDPLNGCPWDLQQTSKSLLPFLLEESQEFMSVIENNHDDEILEELSDVFFQVILHAQISYENKLFTPKDLCDSLNKKLIDRHPHVFTDGKSLATPEEVKHEWNKRKVQHKGLDKLHEAMNLPPILSAHKIGTFSQTVGFDWDKPQEVLVKVEEELQEVKSALLSEAAATDPIQKEHVAEEIGDLLFSVIQLARHLHLSADYCLLKANKKFFNRFIALNKEVNDLKKDLLSMSLAEKEVLWQKVKKLDHEN